MQKSSPPGAKDEPGFLSYQAETASSKEGGTLGRHLPGRTENPAGLWPLVTGSGTLPLDSLHVHVDM